jgi:hypothetical protein
MKTLLLTFVLSLFCACAFPQKITGKWKPLPEVSNGFSSVYESVDCSYNFKKNGELIIKIKGLRNLDKGYAIPEKKHLLQGEVEIKGKYVIQDGKISSFVENEGVKTYASDSKSNYGSLMTDSVSYIVKTFREEDRNSKRLENELRRRLLDTRYLWDWDNEPITITKEELVIGEKLKCRR